MNIKKLSNLIIKVAKSFDDYVALYKNSGEELIAYNRSYWGWEYDSSSRYAVVFRDIARGSLRLVLFEIQLKTGLGAGEWSTKLIDTEIGTVRNPKLGGVAGMLAKNSHQRTRAGFPFSKKWRDDKQQESSLKEIISRYLTDGATKDVEVPEDMRNQLTDALKEVYTVVKDGTKGKKEISEYLEKAISKLSEIKGRL